MGYWASDGRVVPAGVGGIAGLTIAGSVTVTDSCFAKVTADWFLVRSGSVSWVLKVAWARRPGYLVVTLPVKGLTNRC